MKWILFAITAVSCFVLLSYYFAGINPAVQKAVRSRGERKAKFTDVWADSLANKIAPLIEMDEISMVSLKSDLESLGYTVTPQLYNARAISQSVISVIPFLALTLVSPIFLLVGIACAIFLFQGTKQKIKREITARRKAIERELPQFAGTIRQSLITSRNIVSILQSYRKVCGDALRKEIDKTLNDVKMGNEELALAAFEQRINSSKVSELVRGLISVVHGEDQRMYFEMLTHEFIKSENEEIKRAYQERPAKLTINAMLLMFCMVMLFMCGMIMGTLGSM